ncbi:MAG: hypothetical protein ACK4GJ_04645 [bacterium]
MKKIKNKKGLSISEVLTAFALFIIAIFSVIYLYYSVMRINTNSSLAEAAMQNLDVVYSYIKNNQGIVFRDTIQATTNDYFLVTDSNLIQSTPRLNAPNNFVPLNSSPLNNLSFVKPTVFQRNIRVETLWNREGRGNLTQLGYHRVAVYTITIRWRDKNTFRTVSKTFVLSRDEVNP